MARYEGHACRVALADTDTVIHSGTKVKKFPCFWCLVFTAQFQHFFQLFSALFFCYAVSSCVYDDKHPYLVSERLFVCREQGFSVPAESSGASEGSSGYTLRCSGDLACGHFRGRHGEAEKPKNQHSWRSETGRSITVPILAGNFKLNGHCGVIF